MLFSAFHISRIYRWLVGLHKESKKCYYQIVSMRSCPVVFGSSERNASDKHISRGFSVAKSHRKHVTNLIQKILYSALIV